MPDKIQFDSPWNVANMDALFDDVAAAKGSEDTLAAKIAAMDAATAAAETAAENAQAAADAVANAGAKNMLTLNPSSTSSGGVGLTVNADGTITTTGGTSSSATAFQLNTVTLSAGEYILSGCPSGGGDSTYRLDISGTQYYDTGNGVRFTATGAAMTIRIRIGANTSVNNFVWKPMIRNAAIADNTFQQYAPTNRELYEMILAMQGGT